MTPNVAWGHLRDSAYPSDASKKIMGSTSPVVPGHPGTGQKDKRQYVTGDSQEITHPSTSPAQTGLSCEF